MFPRLNFDVEKNQLKRLKKKKKKKKKDNRIQVFMPWVKHT